MGTIKPGTPIVVTRQYVNGHLSLGTKGEHGIVTPQEPDDFLWCRLPSAVRYSLSRMGCTVPMEEVEIRARE